MQLNNVSTTITEPVNLDDLKSHLRIEHDDEDALLFGLITAARQIAEDYTGMVIAVQSFEYFLDGFETPVCLPISPLSAISAVTYYDVDSVEQTLASYHLEKNLYKAEIRPDYDTDWPDVEDGFNKVKIAFTAGFATCPTVIQQAIKLIAGTLYGQREDYSEMRIDDVPLSSRALLNPFRKLM